MAFEKKVIDAVVEMANDHDIDPAGLLAVVEVESAGKPLEDNNRTPGFLFERHKFHECLKRRAPGKLALAVAEGLAHPDWRPKSKWGANNQYRDQGTSKGRRSLLGKAVKIDEECAHYACSWGVGQIMGFHAKEIGFKSAVEMVQFMEIGGLIAQIDVMVRVIKKQNLARYINAHNWTAFARAYNGSGFAQNKYDTKMASAFGRWQTQIA